MKKITLIRIATSIILVIIAILIRTDIQAIRVALFLTSYLIIGYDVLLTAGKNILRGQIFDENFLMSLATLGAFAIREYPEAVAVMLFYKIGQMFEDRAVGQSRQSIAQLMDIRPDYANVQREDGIIEMDPYDVKIGDTIVIKAGEKVPLDSVVLVGNSSIDTSALTGESLPRDVQAGDDILSGCININGLLTAKVVKEFGESTVNKILDLVENASSKKSTTEHFITKFAKYYTPIVVIAAAFIATVPPLLLADATFSKWIYRSLTFLVISCPCALVISVPLGFFGGIGSASKHGILIKGSTFLEDLSKVKTIVFDKTGTLTKGVFKVQNIETTNGYSLGELLKYAAYAENYSNHPISLSIKEKHNEEIDISQISDVHELAGYGVQAMVLGKKVLAGNIKLMENNSIQVDSKATGTVVYVAIDGTYAGYIAIADEIKPDAVKAVKEINANYARTVMFTGDTDDIGQAVAKAVGIQKAYTQMLPQDKVSQLESIMGSMQKNEKIAFVGDGINDAPVLARADVGIAMGGLGSDAAIEAADIVIMDDNPLKIIGAIKISRRTLSIVKQNIVFALGVKGIILILGAVGIASMWAAVFADVGVSVIAILNSVRILRTKL